MKKLKQKPLGGFEPLANFVVVKRDEVKETKTKSGLIMPTMAQPENIGVVMAMGRDATRVLVGLRVMFRNPYSTIRLAEEDYLFMEDTAIVGILR